MSKIYKIYVRKFKPDSMIMPIDGAIITTKNNCATFTFDKEITTQDLHILHGLKEQLELTEKEEYAQMSEAEQKLFIEKKLGLR